VFSPFLFSFFSKTTHIARNLELKSHSNNIQNTLPSLSNLEDIKYLCSYCSVSSQSRRLVEKENMAQQLLKAVSLLVFGTLCCCTWMPNSGNYQVSAFAPHYSSSISSSSTATTNTRLSAQLNKDELESTNAPDNILNRRQALLAGVLMAATTVSTLTVSAPPADASYKAYAQREQDWQERIDKGQVKISTARSLRTQLKEIAPMNDESSKIFCPNGPSSAVSPLMENKCGDRQATASVYGRTQDAAGNSVPGFSGGKYESGFGPSTLSADSVGGFPAYSVQKKR
jgi:hypothetical protein